ncbi:MAG: hypothetical protein ACO1N6_04885 [Microcella sp.]
MSTPIDPPLSRRAARQAEQSAHDAQPEVFAQPITRRGAGGTPVSVPSSAPTDVSYRTQVRPRVPHYDAPPPTHTVIPGAPAVDAAAPPTGHAGTPLAPTPPPVAPPATDGPVRRRDFRPPAEQPAAGPGGQSASQPAAGFDTDLEYHTLLAPRRDAPPPAAPQPPAPAAHVIEVPPVAPAEPSAAPEQTLSRRELRALREQLGLAPEGETGVAPTVPAPALPVHQGVATPGVAPTAPPLIEPGPAPTAVAPPAAPPVMAPPVAQSPLVAPPVAPPPAAPSVASSPVMAPPAAPPVAPPAAFEPAPLAEPAPPLAQPTSGPVSLGSAPTGSHWSVGIDADDDPFENTFSREVGSASSLTSTNALVLPEMPTGSIAGPVTGTGEIIITGMIDLPRVVSSTGTVPTVHESPDIDDLFEPGELPVAPPDAAPVSAAKAVSVHTQAQTIITPTGSRVSSNAVTTALVAATVVMAVVAIGLFVVAAVNGLF